MSGRRGKISDETRTLLREMKVAKCGIMSSSVMDEVLLKCKKDDR